MAELRNCPVCGRGVSTEAKTCPQCGHPLTVPTREQREARAASNQKQAAVTVAVLVGIAIVCAGGPWYLWKHGAPRDRRRPSPASATLDTATGAVEVPECVRLAESDGQAREALAGLSTRQACGCVRVQSWRASKTLRAGLTFCVDLMREEQRLAAEDLAKQTPEERARLAGLRARCSKSRTVLRFSEATRQRICECAVPSGVTPGGLTDAEHARVRNMMVSMIEACSNAATADGLR